MCVAHPCSVLIAGFVFCLIVFSGSINEQLVFSRCTPAVQIYTVLYSITRYGYASITQLFPSVELNTTADEIGLSGMSAFDYGWLPATALLFAVFILGVMVRVQKEKEREKEEAVQHVEGEAESSAQLLASKLVKHFESVNGTFLLTMASCYYMGISSSSLLSAPFLIIFWIFSSTRKVAGKLFIFLALYVDLFILVQYFWKFSLLDKYRNSDAVSKNLEDIGLLNPDLDGSGERWSLVGTLSVPFLLHMLCVRQLRLFAGPKDNPQLCPKETGKRPGALAMSALMMLPAGEGAHTMARTRTPMAHAHTPLVQDLDGDVNRAANKRGA